MSKHQTIVQAREIYDRFRNIFFCTDEANITWNDIYHFQLFGLVKVRSNRKTTFSDNTKGRCIKFIKNPYLIEI